MKMEEVGDSPARDPAQAEEEGGGATAEEDTATTVTAAATTTEATSEVTTRRMARVTAREEAEEGVLFSNGEPEAQQAGVVCRQT